MTQSLDMLVFIAGKLFQSHLELRLAILSEPVLQLLWRYSAMDLQNTEFEDLRKDIMRAIIVEEVMNARIAVEKARVIWICFLKILRNFPRFLDSFSTMLQILNNRNRRLLAGFASKLQCVRCPSRLATMTSCMGLT